MPVITEVRVKLMEENNGDHLEAFCSITFDDCFVVRDLKIIHGEKGRFVAMPDRKITDRCPKCPNKNPLRARYCSQCGTRLNERRGVCDNDGYVKLFADIAHPINRACREYLQEVVIGAFLEERRRSKLPGYVCNYDVYDELREGVGQVA